MSRASEVGHEGGEPGAEEVPDAVGYRRPPAATRFRPGQSGNPKGRPRGRHRELPYEAVLGQTVTIREQGQARRVSAAEAFLLHLTKRGLDGDGVAGRAAAAAIEDARARAPLRPEDAVSVIVLVAVEPGRVNTALQALRMARKLDRYRESARMALEPWLVEAALARLRGRRLTREEQEVVVRATRTPGRVRWPEWWKVKE